MEDSTLVTRAPSGYGSTYAPPATDSPLEIEWSAGARVLFRFCAVYFAFYVVTTQMLGALLIVPGWGFRPIANHGPLQALLIWVGTHVLGAKTVFHGVSGSGDKTIDYAHIVLTLAVAAAGAAFWSYARGDHRHEQGAAKWFRVFLRFALGATMISYGFAKAVPLQMPAPNFHRLLETYGDLSPMGVIWASIGSARGYEMFIGTVEVVCGVLLFIPQTWLVGALMTLAATWQVFMVNMTYDVPVKLFSFQLVLMSVFLLVPELQRVLNVLVLDRTAGPSTAPRLFASESRNRGARIAQIAYGTYLCAMVSWGSWMNWHSPFGGGGPTPPLYGLYDVTEMSTDAKAQPPLATDTTRWRNVYVDRGPALGWVTMDNKRHRNWTTKIDTVRHAIALTSGDSIKWELKYAARATGGLQLDGQVAGHHVLATLEPVDVAKRFLLLQRGFHWVQELPFNR